MDHFGWIRVTPYLFLSHLVFWRPGLGSTHLGKQSEKVNISWKLKCQPKNKCAGYPTQKCPPHKKARQKSTHQKSAHHKKGPPKHTHYTKRATRQKRQLHMWPQYKWSPQKCRHIKVLTLWKLRLLVWNCLEPPIKMKDFDLKLGATLRRKRKRTRATKIA